MTDNDNIVLDRTEYEHFMAILDGVCDSIAENGYEDHVKDMEEIRRRWEQEHMVAITNKTAETALFEMDYTVQETAADPEDPYGHQPDPSEDPLTSAIFDAISELEDRLDTTAQGKRQD